MLNGTTSEIQLRKWGFQTACLTILVSCDKKNAKTSASTKYLKKAIDSGITLGTAGAGAAVGKVAGKITGKVIIYKSRGEVISSSQKTIECIILANLEFILKF